MAPVSIPALPFRLGPYHLIHRIGAGGQAEIYLALKDGTPYAVKCLSAERTPSDRAVADFVRETAIASRLRDPHILPLLDQGKAEGVYFAVNELAVGLTAQQMLEGKSATPSPVPLSLSLFVLKELGAALRYLHRTTVFEHSNSVLFHGDLSPDNVMLTQDGRVLLLDFGSAGQVSSIDPNERHMGKMYFLPAEAIEGQPVTPATDVYSLGVVAFCFLFGRRPFEAQNKLELYRAIRQEEVPRLGASHLVRTPRDEPALRIFFNRALHKNPELRFRSVREFERHFFALRFAAPVPARLADVKEAFTESLADRMKAVEAEWSDRIAGYRAAEIRRQPAPKGEEVPVESLLAKLERRKHPRVPTDPAKLTAAVVAPHERVRLEFGIHELSRGGMLVRWEGVEPHVDAHYPLTFCLEDGLPPLSAVGRLLYVVRRRRQEFVGLKFSRLSRPDERRVDEYVAGRLPQGRQALPEPAPSGEPGPGDCVEVFFSNLKDLQLEFETNIRFGGMFIRSARPLANDEVVVVRIALPKGLRKILLKGRVVYCRPLTGAADSQGHGVGIQLIDSPEAIREAFGGCL